VAEQSLYRRHRPQSFAEVVGQEHVVRTLRNAVERDRVHHAYLFVGSRGTGKTSMAKILARSLNCVNGPTLEPCGVCEPCVSIAAGNSLDVIEMDAASNRSVDDIRDLRERVGYAAAGGRWKVYILDEAHMLTREAWNAFLKTLEEPPPQTVFVLATTEAHKVPATIIDRCQRFDFSRPSPDEIAEVVRRVAELESIAIDDGAVAAVAAAASGSFRDALGTLDQLVAFSGAEIATDDVLELLGMADAELLFRAAGTLAAGDGKGTLEVVAELARSGRDASRFATDLVAHLRRLLVIRTAGGLPTHFFVVAAHRQRLLEQAEQLGDVELIRSIDALSTAIAAIREGDEARMTLELALLRAARPEIDPSQQALAHRLERIERALQGDAAPSAAPAAASPPAPAVPSPTAAAGAPDPEPAPVPDPPAPEAGSADNPVAALAQGAVATVEQVREQVEKRVGGAALDLERIAGAWPAVIDQVRQSGSDLLSAAVGSGRPVSHDPDSSVLEVGFPPSAAFNKRKAEASENRERVAEALRTILGERLKPVFVLLEGDDAEAAAADVEAAEERLSGDELFDRFKSEFSAEEMVEDQDD